MSIEEGKTTVIRISEDDRLSDMMRCNPWRDSKLRLCSKPGGFIRVYDTVIMPDSVYKSICIFCDTTVRDVIGIVLACCNSSLEQDRLCLVQDRLDNRRVMDSEECLLGEQDCGRSRYSTSWCWSKNLTNVQKSQ